MHFTILSGSPMRAFFGRSRADREMGTRHLTVLLDNLEWEPHTVIERFATIKIGPLILLRKKTRECVRMAHVHLDAVHAALARTECRLPILIDNRLHIR